MASTDVQAFLDLAAKRRSVYTIDDNDPAFSTKQIESVVKQALDICPSPWNIKSSCCVILTGKHNKKLYDAIVLPSMRDALPTETFHAMEEKFNGWAAGLGTVLFFESQDIWDELVRSSPRSKPMAEPWSNVVSGMIQHTVWTALSVAGFGCNLQHFDWNGVVVQQIHSQFNIPKSWRLKAELVFGHKYEEPGAIPHKALATVDQRLKVLC